jgi:DNA (cytosine-5)-methyltransferase 1
MRSAHSNNGKPLAIDLCSGAGALSAGFRQEGFHVVIAIEKDRHAAQSYRINNPGVPVIETDIRSTSPSVILQILKLRRGAITALIAGPPCQGYSVAGPRKPRAARNFLFECVARIAKSLQAKIIAMENVPGLRQVGGVSFENRILNSFKKAGYSGMSITVNAEAFGVPQKRKRVIFICTRSNYDLNTFVLRRPKFPTKPTVLNALKNLPCPTVGPLKLTNQSCQKLVLNHRAMAHSAKVIRKIRRIKHGEGPLSYRRLSSDLAHTIIAGHRAMPVHPRQHRTITVREAARLQTLPDNFRFLGPHSVQPLQVANVVPYFLSRTIARSLLRWIENPVRD